MHVDLDPDVAELLGDTAADVVRRAIAPVAAAADEDGHLPATIVDAMQAAGFLDLPADEPELVVTAAGQLATGSAAAALLCVAATAAAAGGYNDGGPVAFIDGGASGAAAPATAAQRAVTAERQGGLWRLTGSTSAEWIAGCDPPRTFIVLARDPDGAEGAFAVDPSRAGVIVGPPALTTGLRAAGRAPLSLTAAPARVIGDGAAVTAARRIWLLGLAATAVGVGRTGLDLAATHLRNRVQFRTTLSRFPALRALVSALDDDLMAADAAVTTACREPSRVPGAARTAAATAVRATGEAIQLHGGYGYIVDTGVERLFRDALSIRARVLGALSRAGDGTAETLLGPA